MKNTTPSVIEKYIEEHDLMHTCLLCGRFIYVGRLSPQTIYNYSSQKRFPKYCSAFCSSTAIIKNNGFSRKGRDHPAYTTGSGRGYDARFRKTYLQSHTLSCAECHTTKGVFHLHHIDENPFNNTDSNVILMCIDCHYKHHAKKRRIYPAHFYKSRSGYTKAYSRMCATRIQNTINSKRSDAFYDAFGHRNFCRANDVGKKLHITRERVRQLRKKNKLKFIKLGGTYLYETPNVKKASQLLTLPKQSGKM